LKDDPQGDIRMAFLYDGDQRRRKPRVMGQFLPGPTPFDPQIMDIRPKASRKFFTAHKNSTAISLWTFVFNVEGAVDSSGGNRQNRSSETKEDTRGGVFKTFSGRPIGDEGF
jgi:hypothetical protein